jgi:hypothetical protein
MLVVFIHSYLKSLLRYKFLILDTYHPDTLYLYEQGFKDACLFSEAKKGPGAKNFGQHLSGFYFPGNDWQQDTKW